MDDCELLKKITNSPEGLMPVGIDTPSEEYRGIEHLIDQGLVAWVGDYAVRLTAQGQNRLAEPPKDTSEASNIESREIAELRGALAAYMHLCLKMYRCFSPDMQTRIAQALREEREKAPNSISDITPENDARLRALDVLLMRLAR